MSIERSGPTVLITGGAGFLGINLTRYLLKKGWRVISYDIAPFDYPERSRIVEVSGDIRDPDRLKAAAGEADIVAHTAAALPLYTPEDIYTTDVLGTRNVLEAARQSGIERVAHISSTAVYGIPDHHPIYEDDRLDGVGPYGEAKILAEYECLKYRARGMCVPILRPKSFIGPERLGVFALLYNWAKEGHGFPMIGRGGNRYQLLDVEDLCEAIFLCLILDRETVNDTFNIGAAEFGTMREDYQAVLDEAGYGKKIKGIPAGPAVFLLRVLEKLRLSPLYKWVYETAAKDSFVSIEKAVNVLGWQSKYSNREALIRNYRWYLANYDRFARQSGISHRVPWKQGILSIAKHFF
ncbi:MAG: NAD-dependent epimerase/dehydratase family protein [Armatimonadetes bacterium]|nr:NAD-dependent epimerase/dehydratase family protein [Armatimonadota bacterium]